MNLKILGTQETLSKIQRFLINRHFALLWSGQTISNFGSWITSNALALTAVMVLNATPAQMGILTALGAIPVLLFGLLAGVWVDRLRRKPILILSDLARGLLLCSIPLAALLQLLHIEQLYVVMVFVETFTVVFEIAHKSFLPSLVSREQLVEGNSKLEASSAIAEIAGPSLSGLLIQAISAPIAIFFDALSFLFSALCIGLIRVQEHKSQAFEERQGIWRDIRKGLLTTFGNPLLRALVACAATRNFFGGAFATLYTLYVVRELGVTPIEYGILVTMGGIGALLGVLVVTSVARRWAPGKVLIVGMLIDGCMTLLIPLAGGSWLVGLVMLLISQLIGDCGAVLYSVNEVSLRQSIVPERLLGRVTGSISFLVAGVGPVGAILAGLLSEAVGIRLTLLIGACGICCSSLWLLCSPIRRLK